MSLNVCCRVGCKALGALCLVFAAVLALGSMVGEGSAWPWVHGALIFGALALACGDVYFPVKSDGAGGAQ